MPKNNKTVKVPKPGQWPDKLTPFALVLGAILSTLGFLLAFLYASPVSGASVNGTELIGPICIKQAFTFSKNFLFSHAMCNSFVCGFIVCLLLFCTLFV